MTEQTARETFTNAEANVADAASIQIDYGAIAAASKRPIRGSKPLLEFTDAAVRDIRALDDLSLTAIDSNESDTHDDMSEAELAADYEDWKIFLAELEREPLPSVATTGRPGGGIAFSTRGYATEEEADAALEAFLMKAFGVSDEDE